MQMQNNSMPSFLSGELATTWQQIYNLAVSQGVDPRSQPVMVEDKRLIDQCQTLTAVSAANMTPAVGNPNQMMVKLEFEEQPGQQIRTSSAQAAAKPTSFA